MATRVTLTTGTVMLVEGDCGDGEDGDEGHVTRWVDALEEGDPQVLSFRRREGESWAQSVTPVWVAADEIVMMEPT